MRLKLTLTIAASFALAAAAAACSQHSASLTPAVPANQTSQAIPATDGAVPASAMSETGAAPDAVKVKFKEYPLPKKYSGPVHITRGLGTTKVLWFTEHGANALGIISTKGVITEHPLMVVAGAMAVPAGEPGDPLLASAPLNARPNPTVTLPPTGNAPYAITAGPSKSMWFTNENNSKNMIGRVTSTKVLQYPVNTNCCLQNIVAGPDNATWFPIANSYDLGTNYIGRAGASGAIKLYALAYGTVPANVTVGPDKNLWFTESNADKIGKMSTSGKILAQYRLPSTDGNLWFTEWGGNRIGRMTRTGKVKEWVLRSAASGPAGITVGPDKALWFCEANANKIGRITTTGKISEYKIPTADSRPFFITLGPDKALWFTEYLGDKIGRIQIQ
ncbi:MAG TPA: hypothetical protein VNG31_06700 [Candidatus Baltobacteraceae bacterium]|nr:hypothetical protein [Candidatus Baltobacteraceae bacterium]